MAQLYTHKSAVIGLARESIILRQLYSANQPPGETRLEHKGSAGELQQECEQQYSQLPRKWRALDFAIGTGATS
jgi:hypothetical protein